MRHAARWGSLLSLATLACGADSDTRSLQTDVVQTAPGDLEQPLITRLSPTRPAWVTSPDGALSLSLFSGSVPSEATLTLARIRAEKSPRGVVGHAYLMSPEATRLRKGARLHLAAAGVAANTSLRLARLDTGGMYYEAVPHQAVSPADGLVAGVISSFGIYAVVDTSKVEVRGDTTLEPYWTGVHALDVGRLSEARAALQVAHDAAPSADTAALLGLSRLLGVLGLPKLNTLLTACGEPSWNASAAFGPSGYFAREAQRGRGVHDLVSKEGFDDDNLVVRRLVPTGVTAEPLARGVCLDGATRTSIADGSLFVTFDDADYDGDGNGLTVDLYVDPKKPRTDSTATLQALRDASPDGSVVIPLEFLNGQLSVTKRFKFQDDAAQADGSTKAPSASSRVGAYAPDASAGAAQGALRILATGANAGQTFEVEFADVRLLPQWPQNPRQVLILSGTVAATVASKTSASDIPLMRDDFDLPSLLSKCSRTAIASLDDDYLNDVLEEMGSELDAIAGLFAVPAAQAGWKHEVSLGLMSRPGSVVIGQTEADLLVAALRLARGLQQIVSHYHLFAGDLRDYVGDGPVEAEVTCPDPCSNSIECTYGTTQGKRFLDFQLAAAVNQQLFVPRATGDLLGASSSLLGALDHALAALRRPSEGTPFNFQAPLAVAGSDELESLLSGVRAGLAASAPAAAARISFFDGAFLAMQPFFAAPPDGAAMRVNGEAGPAAPATHVVATNEHFSCNDGGDLFETVCTAVCDPAEAADCGSSNCSNLPATGAAFCSAYPWAASVTPKDWVLSALLFHWFIEDVSCDEPADCAFASGTCSASTCDFPEVTFDSEAFESWIDSDTGATFLNRAALASLSELASF